MTVQDVWAGIDSPLAQFIASETESAVAAYRARPDLVREHSNIEAAISQSGYGRKQLHELIQNAADAVTAEGGRIKIVLTSDALYCANEGEPFTEGGYRTLMLSHSSEKRDDKIGRFGLGFKSVIQLCSSPMILSRNGSIAWSQNRSRQTLEALHPGLENYPLLRIAEPVDPHEQSAHDDVLAGLMEWATTVVKLPLVSNFRWLSKEMSDFPPQFLLFSPKVTYLDFDDRTADLATSWTAKREQNRVTISDGENNTTWAVFRGHHEVSPMAAVEAGTIAARDNVEVTWAVPVEGKDRRKLGRFWNYFPTQHETSLSGIVNAAFKMNEDRHSILEIKYNEEILTRTLPLMVAAAVSQLQDNDDPSAFLDLLPSRPKEWENWADKVINIPIFKALSAVPCLPDRSGVLRLATEIKVPPALEEATKLLALWSGSVGRDRPWLHESALLGRGREPQVVRLLNEANKKRASIEEWLEEVVTEGSLESYEHALEIAALIDRSYPDYRENMRRSRIVLMADGSVQAPIASRIFLPMDSGDEGAGLVSYDLLHHGDANRYLRALDLQAQDGQGRVKRIAREVSDDYDNVQLADSLWRVTRSLPIPEAYSILEERTSPAHIRVRCRDAKWRPLGKVWQAGGLLTGNTPGDEHLLIDERFHGHDLALMRMLHIQTTLPDPAMTKTGSMFDMWREAEAARISTESKGGPSPVSKAGMNFAPTPSTENLDLLTTASLSTRARTTKLLLSRHHYPAKIEFTSSYRSALRVDGPDLWWVKQHGALDTPLGTVDVKHCTGIIEGIPSGFLPCPGIEEANALGLPTQVEGVQWQYVIPLAEKRLTVPKVHELYGALAKLGVRPPKELLVQYRADSTTRNLTKEVYVAADKRTFDYLRTADQPVILTEHQDLNEALVSNWGLQPVEVQFQSEIIATPADDVEPARLKDHYPFLKRATGIKDSLLCVACTSIEEVKRNSFDARLTRIAKEWHVEGSSLSYVKGQSPKPRLETVLAAFSSRRAPGDVRNSMAAFKKEAEAEARRQRVNRQKTDAGKVAELVGRDTLRSLIPASVKQLLEHRGLELTDQRMFDIVSTLHGTNLLRVLKPALEEAGIDTPDHFRGSRSAKEFVRELGFSPELAGVATKKKPEREEFIGPVRLDPLHGYQELTSRKIRNLLQGATKNTRGLVQLPTGAGKTRVAVESVIRDITEKPGNQLVVWIAQSEELCEQAVDTWSYVWQAAGAPGERMAVSRLWGGNTAVAEETKLHLIVATIQTLSSIEQSRRQIYNWMSDPDIVIIDEAHGATATSYTPVLSWFGRSFSDRSRLLLGLSATPYRGSNEAETERLVARFGRNLIEPDEFSSADAHEYLQNLGVLARVAHEELAGIELQLKDMRSAQDKTAQTAMLEARLDLEQVAGSATRNEAIIDHIRAREAGGPTLVFAASVEHAEALAAVLSVEGIPSAAISGKTDLGHRRAIIEDFRKGKIRVLTNFDVLTQGFDAPKVDAVYVCRPTFSPNKYIQMIGRGLRGPKNGGSSEVLIVNVKDNLDQYGTELAFTKFDYLWNRESVNAG